MSKIKVLLVEDDKNLGTLLADYLNAKGYETTLATDGEKGWEAFKKGDYNFLILDVMMPVKDGFTLAKEIRRVDKNIPILFLTAKSMKEDAIEGFKAGADDYITKPFNMEELLLRMQAIIRRTHAEETAKDEFYFGKWYFNYPQHILENKTTGEKHKLTTKEADLLRLFLINKNKIVERSEALIKIWGDDSYFNSRSMDVYLSKIRKYFKEDPDVSLVTEHGKGFRLIVNEQ